MAKDYRTHSHRLEPAVPLLPPKKRGCGNCCLWGCLVVVLVIVGGFGYAYFQITGMFEQLFTEYSDTQPLQLKQIDVAKIDGDLVERRWDDFLRKLEAGEQKTPFELSSKEVNALVLNPNKQGLDELRKYVTIAVEGSEFVSEASFPLDTFGYPGRFLNISVRFTGRFEKDLLWGKLNDLRVKGQRVYRPGLYDEFPLEEKGKGSLRVTTQEGSRSPVIVGSSQPGGFDGSFDSSRTVELDRIVRDLERIDVRDGKVIFTPKKR